MKNFLISFTFLTSFVSFGQSYILDTTFGNNGTLVDTSVNTAPINIYFENNNYFLINFSNSIVCLNYNGSKNLTFGTNGKLSFNGANETFIAKGSKFTNGFFYIFGEITYSNSSIDKDIFIAKVSTTGVLDSGFGTSGVLRQDFGTTDESLSDILILDDGKIMGIGTKTATTALFVTKYNTNGTVDTLFDANGYKVLPIPQNTTSSGANLFHFESNILVVGKSYYNENSGSILHNDLLLIKMDANGNYITNFGTNGVKKSPLVSGSDLGSYTVFNASLINGNELYFGVYYAYSFTTQIKTLRKYNITNNTLESIGNLPFSYPFFIFDNNQKIYTTGTERCSPTTSSNCSRNFNLYKRTTSGTPDTTFQTTGSYSYNFFPSDLISDDQGSAVYLHSDGKIAMFGYGYNPYSTNGTGLEMLRLVEGTLSNPDIQPQNKFSVFPNPANNEVNIQNQSDELIRNIEIYDISGKLIMKGEEGNHNLKINHIQKGIYILKIETENYKSVLKFIKE